VKFERKRRKKKVTFVSNIVYCVIIEIPYNFSRVASPVRTDRWKNSDMQNLSVR